MARPSTTSRLASQVEELRKLVEQHVERSRPHLCLQVIYDKGSDQAEIDRLKAEAAAKAGVDPAHVTLWIEYNIVKPKPVAATRATVQSLRRETTRWPSLARQSRASLMPLISAPEPERPREIDYPNAGVA